MDILKLFSCLETRKPGEKYEADRQKQASTGLAKAQVDQKDIFSELLNNVQALGENFQALGKNAERDLNKLGENLGSIFGLQEKPVVPETTRVKPEVSKTTDPSKNTQQPSSQHVEKQPKKKVTFSTDFSSDDLQKLKKDLQNMVASTGSPLETGVTQQFKNFKLIEQLQVQYLEKLELMRSQFRNTDKLKTNIELDEINTKIEFLALGGNPSKIGLQNSSSSRKLNPEQIEALLTKIYNIRQRFNKDEGQVGIIMHSLKKWEGSVSALEEKKDNIAFKPSTVLKGNELTLLQQIYQTNIALSRDVLNTDPKTSPAKDLLDILFKFIALGGKDTVNVSNTLVYIQTAFRLKPQDINEIAKRIKSNTINTIVLGLQKKRY